MRCNCDVRWYHRALMPIIFFFVGLVKDLTQMTGVEREYLANDWPRIWRLGTQANAAGDSGANTEARWYKAELDTVRKPAEARLRAAGITSERQLYLERLTIYSDRKWWGNDAPRFWNSLQHTRFLRTLVRLEPIYVL